MDDLYGTGFRNVGRRKGSMDAVYANSSHLDESQDSDSMNSQLFPPDSLPTTRSTHQKQGSQSIYSLPIPDGFSQGTSQLENIPNQLPAQGSRGRISIQARGEYPRQSQEVPSTVRQDVNNYQRQRRPIPNFPARQIDTVDSRPQKTNSYKRPSAPLYGENDLDDPLVQTPPSSSRLRLQSFNFQPTKQMPDDSSPLQRLSIPTEKTSVLKKAVRPQTTSRRPLDSFQHRSDEDFVQASQAALDFDTPARLPESETISGAFIKSTYESPPRSRGVQLVSTNELSGRLQQVFPHRLFNAVQSKCFEPVYKTNDNIVVAAPTGSGKTVILELAICRLVEIFQAGQFKIVYQAPTKSLCAERFRDWEKKFSHLGLNCAELTGDTESSEMRNAGNATIIITTPEKWDSVTRKWKDHMKLLQMVKLFLIDEVHILKDLRGATLEAVVSRMKTIGANVRFVALSATVPNSEDIAIWLGKDHNSSHLPAHRETFSEDFRPVKLQKHVHGYENKANNPFSFDKFLDSKICNLILRYNAKKPIMVFCFTRSSCETTAAVIAKWWNNLKASERAWQAPSQSTVVAHKDVQELLKSGVAFHHAGLTQEDKSAIESAYLHGQISVICCTSTLAVGVNLPCHMVVLKNTVGFQDGGQLKEYSDLEVMQMLGRAGRPQFDNTAVAIIMTTNDKADKYRRMVSGQDVLESTLHLNLIEHLNSEIGLGTVKDLYSAKLWLAGTFLAVRIRRNPTYYRLEGVASSTLDVGERLERVCELNIKLLQDTKLITSDHQFLCTEYGIAMAKFMVPFETMKVLLSIPEHAKVSQLLHILSQAPEFTHFRIRQNERGVLRNLNECGLLSFPIKTTISTTAHKVSLMIQAQLSGAPMPEGKDFNLIRKQFSLEQKSIMERMKRLLMCLIDCKAYDCDGISTKNALELMRSIAAEFWEYSSLQLQQIPNLGPVACRKFIGAGINSIEKLIQASSQDLERIMTKNPPYGQNILIKLKEFPRLRLAAESMPWKPTVKTGPVRVNVNVRLSLGNTKATLWQRKSTSVTFTAETTSGLLVQFWRGSLRRLEKIVELKFAAQLDSHGDRIFCHIACDEIVGTQKTVVLEPQVPASAFPEQKALPPPPAVVLERRTTPDEFGSDDIDDQDIIDVARKTEKSHVEEALEDEFIDIDVFDDASEENSGNSKGKTQYHSVKLPNGKWQCQHACTGGKTTHNKPCKHRCCHEGLEKPPKIRPKGPKMPPEEKTKPSSHVKKSQDESKTESKFKKPALTFIQQGDNADNDEEVFDIERLNSSPEYKDMASREYKQFGKFHNVVQGHSDQRITSKNNIYAFASKERPDLPTFLHEIQQEESSSIVPSSTLLDNDPFADDSAHLPTLAQLLKHDSENTRKALELPMEPAPLNDPLSGGFNVEIDTYDMDMLQPSQIIDDQNDLCLSDGFERSVVDYQYSSPAATPIINAREKMRTFNDSNTQDSVQDIQQEEGQFIETEVGMKRGAEEDPLLSVPNKFRRVEGTTHLKDFNDDEGLSSDSLKATPEWVKDFDPDLLSFFDGLVEYV